MPGTFSDLWEARESLAQAGGYLLDIGGGCYLVTDDCPTEHRSFSTHKQVFEYACHLAEAGYDETRMEPNG